MNGRSFWGCLAAAGALVASADAAKVKVWYQQSRAHYEKAQFRQAVVSSEGAVRLSRQLKPFVPLDATHVWDVVEDKNGTLYAATGDEGKLYKITPDGKSVVVYAGEESQVFGLALAADGSVYAGTGPNGLIVRVGPDGTAKVLYQSPESYVWSLALDPAGTKIYAGTGPKGRIYQVTPEGKASIFYTTKQDHILALAVDAQGAVYAGTDKNGLVYRIDAKGKGFILYNAAQSEVRTLSVTPAGVYAGTSSPTKRRGSVSSSPGERPSAPVRFSTAPVSVSKTDTQTSSDEADTGDRKPTGSSSKEKEADRLGAAPSAPPPASGDNSLYRIASDGTVREVFRERALVLSQLHQNGRILVGTGMEGQLFEVDETTRERTEVARLDHGQIHCLYRRHDGSIILGTGDPGRLYVLQDKYVPSGTIVSEVLDARIISKWGTMRWQADIPAGTAVSVAVRSGNVAEPDETWSDWSAEQANPQTATVTAPSARFLQYRITLSTENPAETPSLRGLSIRYITTNQAPEVSSIEVPDIDSGNLEQPKKLKVRWTATDANEDELTYSLLVRKEGWKNWVQLEENWDKRDYEWDTTTAPSGTYQFKVVASDRRDNPAEEAVTAERVSVPFVVSHTPPAVTVKVAGIEGEEAVLEATATDPLARLTAAAFAVNGKKWTNVFPADGLFDAKSESFRFKTEPLKPGTYVLVLRVTDAAGNSGTGDVVFTVQSKPPGR